MEMWVMNVGLNPLLATFLESGEKTIAQKLTPFHFNPLRPSFQKTFQAIRAQAFSKHLSPTSMWTVRQLNLSLYPTSLRSRRKLERQARTCIWTGEGPGQQWGLYLPGWTEIKGCETGTRSEGMSAVHQPVCQCPQGTPARPGGEAGIGAIMPHQGLPTGLQHWPEWFASISDLQSAVVRLHWV